MSSTPPIFLSSRCAQHNSPDNVRQETLRRIEVYTLTCLARLLDARADPPSTAHNVDALSNGDEAEAPTRTHRSSAAPAPAPSSSETGLSPPLPHRVLVHRRHELLILSLLYRLTQRGLTCTQREVYYQLVRHVPGQGAINAYVQRLVRVLQIPRETLGVVAGARGFVCGTLTYRGTALSGLGAEEGMSIPVTDAELTVASYGRDDSAEVPENHIASTAAFVLQPHTRAIVVVEKHAVYHQLCLHGLTRLFPCVVLTSQGYPCLSARKLVHALHRAAPHLPVVGLADFNPAGVAILLQYKFGLGQMTEAAHCATPALQWLGLRSARLCAPSPSVGAGHNKGDKMFNTHVAHQAFTARDVSMSANLCARLRARVNPAPDDVPRTHSALSQPPLDPRWLAEVEQMQAWRVKVELEALYEDLAHTPRAPGALPSETVPQWRHSSPKAFVEWLSRELLQHHYI